MTVVITRRTAADIFRIEPAGRVARDGLALIGLVEGGVVILHPGINIGHHNALPLPKNGPELVSLCINHPPAHLLGRQRSVIHKTTGQRLQRRAGQVQLTVRGRIDKRNTARHGNARHLRAGRQGHHRLQVAAPHIQLVARNESMRFQAALGQVLARPGLAALGHLAQRVINELAARLPFHLIGQAQVSLFDKAHDPVSPPLGGQLIQQALLNLLQPIRQTARRGRSIISP